ncbi:MAG: peptidoglycan editing factor PgeF [Pseudomonadota bacterium]
MTLEIIRDEAFGALQHGFFTRKGGASSGVFEGLNCGYGSSDLAEVVSINRERVANVLGVNSSHLVTLHQVHSTDVVVLDAPPEEKLRADALVTATPGIALAVLTADCQPVLFADPEAGVIAAAHAGWRGAFDGVLEQTLDAMEKKGARRESIRATIGPSISQSVYEVGPEFFERFIDEDPANSVFFINNDAGKYLFDLPGYGLRRLRSAGVEQASWTRNCTYSDATRFFSYRRATHEGEADYGRLISAIRL